MQVPDEDVEDAGVVIFNERDTSVKCEVKPFELVGSTEPSDITFVDENGKEMIRFTADRKIIVSGDVYEAAKTFWDCLIQINPRWALEKDSPLDIT